ncbi:MAG: hypothetical protein E6300_06255 [Clostridium sp.]|uniref:hypothetical protein n=1 Tax=Clostridium sp. TaxID=1506 RepID=UPI001ECC0D73|nr:hypothetical protein [Clostridium sp.]MBS5884035.1 hypothetical protein [Clostridium sp.]MDU7148074.1 hypothetical protein [Clostridium sp.]MDU7241163.1 hypothetical protein [Clostridium sp.]
MIKKIYSLTLLMLLITLPNNISASTISSNSVSANIISSNTNIPTVSNVYTEGFYRFDNETNIDMIIMLSTDVPTKLIIFDDEMNIKFLSDLPYKNKFYIRNFQTQQIVGIVGGGQVAISFEPIN